MTPLTTHQFKSLRQQKIFFNRWAGGSVRGDLRAAVVSDTFDDLKGKLKRGEGRRPDIAVSSGAGGRIAMASATGAGVSVTTGVGGNVQIATEAGLIELQAGQGDSSLVLGAGGNANGKDGLPLPLP